MGKWIINVLLLPLLLLLPGCKNAYSKELILIDDLCQPPCWNNIDPRKTTTSDVIVQIQKNRQLDQ